MAASLTVDLISGRVFLFDCVGGGGGTGSTTGTTFEVVSTYTMLPPAGSHNDEIYVVLNSEGTYVFDRKEAGLYYSNGVSWRRLGDIPSFFLQDNFQIYNSGGTSGIRFNTSGITGSTFREITWQNQDGTVALLSDVASVSANTVFNAGNISTISASTMVSSEFQNSFFDNTYIDNFDITILTTGATTEVLFSKRDDVTGDTRYYHSEDNEIRSVPPQIVALSNGTQTSPVVNYLFITGTTVMADTSAIDFNNGETLSVGTVVLQTNALTASNGVLKIQRWSDHFQDHLQHITERMRSFRATYFAGLSQSVEISGTSNAYFVSTSGQGYQLHLQNIPAHDERLSADTITVTNEPTNQYDVWDKIGDATVDTEGNNLRINQRRSSFVVWVSVNSPNNETKWYVNLPSGFYLNDGDVENDLNNYADYSIPNAFNSTGILVAKVNLSWMVDAWSLVSIQDLRGLSPSTTVGGGSVGSQVLAKNSIEVDTDQFLQLVNDEPFPAPTSFYGTNSGSTRGWYEIPEDTSKADAFSTINTITGDTLIDDSYNTHIVQASGSSGNTGYTITIASGLTTGFNVTFVNFLESGTVTFSSQGTLLSRDGSVTMVDQYGGASLYHQGNNVHVLMGDIT